MKTIKKMLSRIVSRPAVEEAMAWALMILFLVIISRVVADVIQRF